MKRIVLSAMLCAFVAVPALADPTVVLYQQAGYSYSNGGEFTAHPIGWTWNPLVYYDISTKDIGNYDPSFQTFCVEEGETFSPGAEYSVTFSDRAIKGGVGAAGDPISIGTAWLYHMFQSQDPALTPFDWSATNRAASAGALQQAIWYLEGESIALPTAYATLLANKFGSLASAKLDNDGAYPVEIMNLWDKGYAGDQNHLHQDQLVCVPIPAAVLLGLLGLGAAGLKLRKYA